MEERPGMGVPGLRGSWGGWVVEMLRWMIICGWGRMRVRRRVWRRGEEFIILF